MSEQEQKRWERLRRALMNIVAQQHEADPTSRYTLDIRITLRESGQRVA